MSDSDRVHFWIGLTILTAIIFVHAKIVEPENAPESPPARVQAAEGRGEDGSTHPPSPAPAAIDTDRSLQREHSEAGREGECGITLTPELIFAAIDECWWRESRNGQDPRAAPGIIGSAGERGQYQLTPIFIREIARLGFEVDPYDNDQCRYAAYIYFSYWGPRVGAQTVDELYELYRRGPTGYRAWKGD